MKKIIVLLAAVLAVGVLFTSCRKDNKIKLKNVIIALEFPQDYSAESTQGITVTVTSQADGITYEAQSDAEGKTQFQLVAGSYSVGASDTRSINGDAVSFNGTIANLIITPEWNEESITKVVFSASKAKQLIIKELYFAGCQKNDASGTFNRDPYVILYNNSEVDVDLNNLCLGFSFPFNSWGTNYDMVDGKLSYENEGYMYTHSAIWSLGSNWSRSLKPGEQILVAINGAINNTETYTNSVDLSNSDYVMYDPESGYNLASYYPAPSEKIPSSHYLKAYKWGMGTGWSLSVSSPAFVIFNLPTDTTPQAFLDATDNVNYYQNKENQVNMRKKIMNDWVSDAVDVWAPGKANNFKRLPSSIDGGSIEIEAGFGYTVYRNVDQARTEAIPGNKAKLVYNYNGGTEASTDPSGIDAEASIANGAFIYYKDTNNSTNDFHQRKVASIKK